MRYGSVCSGIEAATAAWHHMGWEPAFFSEIEAFPRAVLEHHYPDVPLHGDFTTIEKNQYGKIDLLVGGTPCQSFSVAGLRGGLDDERGNLALEFCRLAQREQPRWIVWENVPGVLSSNGGRDFGSILGALEDLGYGLAYRVLDAQYFGVAQRRRRVFVVGYLGDWRPAAAVLFERHSMSGHPAPSREARKEAADTTSTGAGGGGVGGGNGVAVNISNGEPRLADITGTLDCWSMKGRGSSQQQAVLTGPLAAGMHKGPRGTESVESNHIAVHGTQDPCVSTDTAFALGRNNGAENTVVYPIDTQNMTEGHASGNQGGDYIVQAYDILGVLATQGAKTTDVHVPLRARAPGQSEASTTTVILQQEESVEVVAFAQNTRDEVRLIGGDGQISGALAAQPGMKQTTYVAFSSNMSTPDFQTDGTTPTVKVGGHGGNPPAVVMPFDTTQITSPHNYSSPKEGDPCHPLAAGAHPPAVAIGFNGDQSEKTRSMGEKEEQAPTLRAGATCHVAYEATQEVAGTLKACAGSGGWSNSADHAAAGYMALAFQPTADCLTAAYASNWNGNASATNGSLFAHTKSAVRRLTPVECERLQGFPDNFTAIPWRKKGADQCPDGPRYKALGNSMAVPVMRWIGERIQRVDDLISVL